MLISWDIVREAGIADKTYADLLHVLTSDHDQHLWDEHLKEYKRFRQDMSTIDGIVLYKGRIVIPPALRLQVLQAIHRSHQGTTGMALRSSNSVWWPGLANDISGTREQCVSCRRNAPSQSSQPPLAPPTPDYPFQMLSSDFFDYAGHQYLVVIDRYSNWPLVKHCQTGSAQELVNSLRDYFLT